MALKFSRNPIVFPITEQGSRSIEEFSLWDDDITQNYDKVFQINSPFQVREKGSSTWESSLDLSITSAKLINKNQYTKTSFDSSNESYCYVFSRDSGSNVVIEAGFKTPSNSNHVVLDRIRNKTMDSSQ